MFVIVKPFLLPKGVLGMTLWPYILLKTNNLREDKVLINHERIHLRQQIQLLVVFFYLWYGLEYLIRLIQYRNKRKAYLNISMEREAYANQDNPDYLKRFILWSFLRYL